MGCCAELAGDNARNARSAFIFYSALLSLSLPPTSLLLTLSLSSCLSRCQSFCLIYLFAALSVRLSVWKDNVSPVLAMTIYRHACHRTAVCDQLRWEVKAPRDGVVSVSVTSCLPVSLPRSLCKSWFWFLRILFSWAIHFSHSFSHQAIPLPSPFSHTGHTPSWGFFLSFMRVCVCYSFIWQEHMQPVQASFDQINQLY